MLNIKNRKMHDIIQKHIEKLMILISKPTIPFDSKLRRILPTEGGVYRILETSSDWKKSIYIGEGGNLQNRVYSNLLMGNRKTHTPKRKLIEKGLFGNENAVRQYLKDKCQVQYIEIPNERERILFEHFAISVLNPEFND